ncbi:unnamed protein product [Effrenium voratum]|nr:unnamed protein product [Effrenium voratum]
MLPALCAPRAALTPRAPHAPCAPTPRPVRVSNGGHAGRWRGRLVSVVGLSLLTHRCRTARSAEESNEGEARGMVRRIQQALDTYGEPLELSVLGSFLEWSSELRRRHGRLSVFLRQRPELWLSAGCVGTVKPRTWPDTPTTSLSSLRAVELFSGIGGLRAAFHRACHLEGRSVGQMSEWVNFESSRLANQVYSRNFSVPYEPLLPRDIRRLQASEVEGADLWVMSPPCQPYTRMGLQRDLADRRAAPLKRLLELLPKLRRPPEGLLLENVVGFETSASFELLSEALCRAGLEVRQFMLSPLQLGIPNRRPRIYLLARRSDTPCVHPLESEFPGQQRSPEPQRLETFLQPRQEIDTETSVPAKLLELLWNRGQRWEVVTAGSTSSSTFTSGYTTTCFDAHRFGPLLAESGDDRRSDWCPPRPLPGGRMQRLVEPGEAVRYFTPQELLRIHGFPETFSFGKVKALRSIMTEAAEERDASVRAAHLGTIPDVRYVLSRKDELDRLAAAEDSAAGPFSVSPFVPCAAGRIPYVLQAARLSSEDVLWDLGCGDGVVLIEAARRCGCRCVGLDIDGPCIEAARRRACEAGVAELCTWLRCDMLTLPQELQGLAATVALVFLTAHGLEWASARLRLITCVEPGERDTQKLIWNWVGGRSRSLDSAVDFNEPDALFANPNPLNWPVCRDLERWGVFVVPPCGEDVGAWSAGARPLQLTRAEAEATQAVVLRVLDEATDSKGNDLPYR